MDLIVYVVLGVVFVVGIVGIVLVFGIGIVGVVVVGVVVEDEKNFKNVFIFEGLLMI